MRATTRDRLERVALDLFEDDGYDAVTTARIAAATGVTQRTFFRHFPTKLDVLVGEVPDRLTVFVEALRAQPVGLPLLDALHRAIAQTLPSSEQISLDLRRGRILRETTSLAGVVRSFEESLEARLAEWIADRSGREAVDFDVRVTAALLVAARRVVIDEWTSHGAGADVIEIARRAALQLGQLEPALT